MRASLARRLGSVIGIGAGLGVIVAAAIAVSALVRERPVGGASALLILAVPLIVAGQLWTIAWIRLRQPQGKVSWRRGSTGRAAIFPVNPGRWFFGPLQRRTMGWLLAFAIAGWLLAMTAFPAIANGGPAAPGDGCSYRLDNHGSLTCVSRAAYDHAGAGEQRFAAGILLFFFAIHLGAALGGRQMQRVNH